MSRGVALPQGRFQESPANMSKRGLKTPFWLPQQTPRTVKMELLEPELAAKSLITSRRNAKTKTARLGQAGGSNRQCSEPRLGAISPAAGRSAGSDAGGAGP